MIFRTLIFGLGISIILAGCNTLPAKNNVASACQQGIDKLDNRLSAIPPKANKIHVHRANSLLHAAQVQQQFEQYPSCVDKVRRADDYLNSHPATIVSTLTI